jgi:hypothetical protein
MERQQNERGPKLPDPAETDTERLRNDISLAAFYLGHLDRERGVQNILYNADGEPLDGSKFRLKLGTGTGMAIETDTIQVMTSDRSELGRPLTAKFAAIPGNSDGRSGWILEENVRHFSNSAGERLLKRQAE